MGRRRGHMEETWSQGGGVFTGRRRGHGEVDVIRGRVWPQGGHGHGEEAWSQGGGVVTGRRTWPQGGGHGHGEEAWLQGHNQN